MIKSGRAQIQGANRGTSPSKSTASTPVGYKWRSITDITRSNHDVSRSNNDVSRSSNDVSRSNNDVSTNDGDDSRSCSSSSSETESSNEGALNLKVDTGSPLICCQFTTFGFLVLDSNKFY